jgi:hypothetical protein
MIGRAGTGAQILQELLGRSASSSATAELLWLEEHVSKPILKLLRVNSPQAPLYEKIHADASAALAAELLHDATAWALNESTGADFLGARGEKLMKVAATVTGHPFWRISTAICRTLADGMLRATATSLHRIEEGLRSLVRANATHVESTLAGWRLRVVNIAWASDGSALVTWRRTTTLLRPDVIAQKVAKTLWAPDEAEQEEEATFSVSFDTEAVAGDRSADVRVDQIAAAIIERVIKTRGGFDAPAEQNEPRPRTNDPCVPYDASAVATAKAVLFGTLDTDVGSLRTWERYFLISDGDHIEVLPAPARVSTAAARFYEA